MKNGIKMLLITALGGTLLLPVTSWWGIATLGIVAGILLPMKKWVAFAAAFAGGGTAWMGAAIWKDTQAELSAAQLLADMGLGIPLHSYIVMLILGGLTTGLASWLGNVGRSVFIAN